MATYYTRWKPRRVRDLEDEVRELVEEIQELERELNEHKAKRTLGGPHHGYTPGWAP